MAAYMSRRRRPRIELRVQVLGFLVLCGLGVIVARLWWIQVARGSSYSMNKGRQEVRVRIPSVRGEIRDRNGVVLVQNRASYEVDFYLQTMVDGYTKTFGKKPPQVPYVGTENGMPHSKTEDDIVAVVNEAVIPRLQELDLARDYNSVRLKNHFRNNRQIPFTYIEDIDFPTIAKYSEHDVGLPGVEIAVKPVRQYLYGALAAHVLGYVGMPTNQKDLPDIDDYEFYQADVQGKTGIEASMDDYLRGTPGVRVMQRNLKGVIDTEIRVDPPKPGNNVYLTIDARIQSFCEEALRSVPRGAVVVIDPNNGDVLGMASVPSYDPNSFIPTISGKDYAAIKADESSPLLNRAVNVCPPGSIFKIITSFAGLRKKIGGNLYTCNGSVTYGNRPFHCWIAAKGGSHGTIGLTEALKVSCDCFFYQYGNTAGIDSIDDTAKMIGLGEKTGVELPEEVPGVIPSPDSFAQRGRRMGQGDIASISIGQGDDLVSPLQMALAYATVANGGISYYPRIVRTVLTPEGRPLLDEEGQPVMPDAPKIRADLRSDFSKQQIDLVRLGLWKVVNDPGGTGAAARLKSIIVAGKTGTAQAWRGHTEDDVAWFCCFAPYDKPRYSICVMVNGGQHGGSVAAPIAARVLDQCVAMDNGTLAPELKPFAPAHSDHPFELVAQVTYKNGAPALGTPGQGAPDEESRDNTDTPHAGGTQTGGPAAEPDIRPDADAQGQVSQNPAPKPTPDKRSIFQRFFNPNRTSAPATTPHPPRAH